MNVVGYLKGLSIWNDRLPQIWLVHCTDCVMAEWLGMDLRGLFESLCVMPGLLDEFTVLHPMVPYSDSRDVLCSAELWTELWPLWMWNILQYIEIKYIYKGCKRYCLVIDQ